MEHILKDRNHKEILIMSIDKQCQLAAKHKLAMSMLSTDQKNSLLSDMAQAILDHSLDIIEQNKIDIENGKRNQLSTALIDRLLLTPERLKAISQSLITIRDLSDPIGEVIDTFTRPNGLAISKVRVPLGVIGIIYEARPNVTVDGIALSIKSGNCLVLRGSSSAYQSNLALTNVLKEVMKRHGINPDAIQLLEDTSREGVLTLVKLTQYLDLVMPRGGAELIQHVLEHATVPTIETGAGVCHVYVDKDADLEKALSICINAKTHRPSVCNACETILVHESISEQFLPHLLEALQSNQVVIKGCPLTCQYSSQVEQAIDNDWATEYSDLIISIKVVKSLQHAMDHIHTYGSNHTDAILSENQETTNIFSRRVDSAAIIVNASTRFTDGGEFGFGAEMGISTQKLHARGPVGLPELTSYKYIVIGDGQTRD